MHIKAQSQKHAWAYCWQTQMSFCIFLSPLSRGQESFQGAKSLQTAAWVIDSSSWLVITSTP